jgi:hypothetical protein
MAALFALPPFGVPEASLHQVCGFELPTDSCAVFKCPCVCGFDCPPRAFIESFNGRVRSELLNAHWFHTLSEAQTNGHAWMHGYNTTHAHSSLGYLTPEEFLATYETTPTSTGISGRMTGPSAGPCRSELLPKEVR